MATLKTMMMALLAGSLAATAGGMAYAKIFEITQTPQALSEDNLKALGQRVMFYAQHGQIGPLAIVAAMKQDPALASIPTVGYASHVQTDVIQAARQAGVDNVLARSAFTQQLPEILGGHR